ncbi:VapC toxin family PIN domain ribonuclease [Mixta theicola]|uniref:VapC toxin family PIN domain ribonuclease n=1 Tax=Mixta theicola TaxID=1458355 RepID=A0A2K1Q9X0_9GAMM|nr:type II toxin-antitoxin system VapC family toxin [Mixta theicola]PNS11826.1 VapC toxin family PIN domain ribonuclease [Mixta theicola]GLR07747.1 twitching motility protein PilT [Mixta theicola]
MRYLLDTNVFSELRKAGTQKIDANVARWAESVDAGDLFISVITVMEIEKGILNLARKDASQAAILRQWFEQRVLTEFAERILAIDVQVARYCAQLHIPDKRSENDALIATTAYLHEMILVTRNTKDFIDMGPGLLDPWETA